MEETHTSMGRTRKLQREKPCPSQESTSIVCHWSHSLPPKVQIHHNEVHRQQWIIQMSAFSFFTIKPITAIINFNFCPLTKLSKPFVDTASATWWRVLAQSKIAYDKIMSMWLNPQTVFLRNFVFWFYSDLFEQIQSKLIIGINLVTWISWVIMVTNILIALMSHLCQLKR